VAASSSGSESSVGDELTAAALSPGTLSPSTPAPGVLSSCALAEKLFAEDSFMKIHHVEKPFAENLVLGNPVGRRFATNSLTRTVLRRGSASGLYTLVFGPPYSGARWRTQAQTTSKSSVPTKDSQRGVYGPSMGIFGTSRHVRRRQCSKAVKDKVGKQAHPRE
jgi:hypothetical protein